MDIRKARAPKGAVPSSFLAQQKEPIQSADMDEANTAQVTELDPYGGDIVIKEYMEFLEKNGISKDDVEAVLNALITEGTVSWGFTILGSVPAEFTVRPAWVDDCVSARLDKVASESARVSNVRFNNIVAECNLAATLTSFKDARYSIKTEEDFDEACERVRNLPFVIQNALVRKLAVFDRVLAVAMSDWAVANFTKPREEKSEQN